MSEAILSVIHHPASSRPSTSLFVLQSPYATSLLPRESGARKRKLPLPHAHVGIHHPAPLFFLFSYATSPCPGWVGRAGGSGRGPRSIGGQQPAASLTYRCFIDYPCRKLGEILLGHLRGTKEPGIPGDREVTDARARELKPGRWFEWKLFDVD